MARTRRVPISFPLSLARGRSSLAGMSGLVNCYAEPVKGEGRTRVAVYPMPGRELFSTIGGGSVRGQADFGAYHAATVGDNLYTIESDGTATDRGEIEGTDRVDMDFNGAQLFVAGTIKSYTYVPSSASLAEVTDSDFLGATSCASLNGYTITTVPNSDQFQWFNLRDATSVDALDFATAESNGDINVAVRVANEDVYLFGKKTIEPFYNSGNPNQQFEARSVPPMEIGCLSRDSIVLADTAFVWVGRDGKSGGIGVYRMVGGYTAKKISTPAVDRFLEEFPADNVDTIEAIAFQWYSHLFYVLRLPGVVSLFYDLASDQWGFLISGTYPSNELPLGDWDAITFATNGQNRIIGGSDGNLYKLTTANTDAGNPIIREIIWPQLSAPSNNGAILHKVTADFEVGVGNGTVSDPHLSGSISKDGGKTWRALIDRSLGAVGKYETNLFWDRLGRFQDAIIRTRVSDAVTFAAAGDLMADIEPLN